MKVNDIVSTQFVVGNFKMNFVVKPKGTDIKYYVGDGNWMRMEVADMEVVRWLIDGNNFVIFVERNAEFEEKRKQFLSK